MKYKKYKISICALLLISGVNSLVTKAQTKIVTINKSKQFQKIDGFGAYGLGEVAWGTPPFYGPNFVKTVVEDLGMTISRAESYPMESSNDNNNPLVADMSRFSPSGFNRAYWQFAKEAQALANSYGDTIKFFYSVWTPPAWMKYTGTENGTDVTWNRLIARDFTPPDWSTFVLANKPAANPDDYKDEFVEHCIVSAQMFKANAGFDLYGYSLQNELAFGQPYNSCVYSPQQYRELLKVAGPRFRKEFPNLKMIMHEDIGDLGRFRQFMEAVTRDPEALKYQDIGACHAYNATGTLAGSTSASTWDGMYRVTNFKKPTPFWQTETSGYGLGWDGGLSLAKAMYVGLKFGKVSAWVWWQLSSRTTEQESTYELMKYDGTKYKKYFTVKHFARYIRPNAIAVEATCSTDADILPLAFQHNTKSTLTLVLINQSNVEKTIKLAFADQGVSPASYKVYQTNNNDNCADKGTLAANAELKIPANTLVTLVGEGSLPVITSNDMIEQESNNLFEIHPNPSTNYAIVEFKSNNSSTIEVFDAYSKLVKSMPLTYGANEINTSDLADGVYFVKIGNSTKKLIVNK